MLKYFLRLLSLIAAIVSVLLLFEQLLPRSYDFERSVEIDCLAEEVFPYLNSPKKWSQWSQQFNTQWIEGEFKYNATDEGVGAAQTWTEIRGPSKAWITESKPNEALTYVGGLQSFPKMTNTFSLKPTGEGKTIVRWRSTGRLPRTPLYGLGAFLFDTQMGYEHEKSLAALKFLVEQE